MSVILMLLEIKLYILMYKMYVTYTAKNRARMS